MKRCACICRYYISNYGKGFLRNMKGLLWYISATSHADAFESLEVLGFASVNAMLFFVDLSLQSLMSIQATIAMAYTTNRWPFYYVNRDIKM